jgi:hypothetical protein
LATIRFYGQAASRAYRPSIKTVTTNEGIHEMKIILAIPSTKFPLGQIVMTANAADQLDPADIQQGLTRHAQAIGATSARTTQPKTRFP